MIATEAPAETRTLKLEGRDFRLTFTDIMKRETSRGFNRYHDDRDQFPAWMWTGRVSIFDRWYGNEVDRPFSTDRFWKGHVGGLTFEKIIFLALRSAHLWKIVPTSSQRMILIDQLAARLVRAYIFHQGSCLDIEPFKFEGVNGIQPSQLNFEEIVVTEEMVPI